MYKPKPIETAPINTEILIGEYTGNYWHRFKPIFFDNNEFIELMIVDGWTHWFDIPPMPDLKESYATKNKN